jgi:gamma-glutamyltranspeptidase/glutathione hydrolase
MTTTIENEFGNRLMTRSGFLLNNRLTDFSFVPVDSAGRPVANHVERAAPALGDVADHRLRQPGRVAIVAGSPGGPAIVNCIAKTLVGIIDWHLDAQAAIDLPSMGSRNGPTELERSFASRCDPSSGARSRHAWRSDQWCARDRTPWGWSGGADRVRRGAWLLTRTRGDDGDLPRRSDRLATGDTAW